MMIRYVEDNGNMWAVYECDDQGQNRTLVEMFHSESKLKAYQEEHNLPVAKGGEAIPGVVRDEEEE